MSVTVKVHISEIVIPQSVSRFFGGESSRVEAKQYTVQEHILEIGAVVDLTRIPKEIAPYFFQLLLHQLAEQRPDLIAKGTPAIPFSPTAFNIGQASLRDNILYFGKKAGLSGADLESYFATVIEHLQQSAVFDLSRKLINFSPDERAKVTIELWGALSVKILALVSWLAPIDALLLEESNVLLQRKIAQSQLAFICFERDYLASLYTHVAEIIDNKIVVNRVT